MKQYVKYDINAKKMCIWKYTKNYGSCNFFFVFFYSSQIFYNKHVFLF